MNNTSASATTRLSWSSRFAPLVRAFHTYAGWLVSISWKRFFLLALLLLISAGILQNLPPFSWTISERVETKAPRIVVTPPKPPKPAKTPSTTAEPGSANKNAAPIEIERPKGGAKNTSGNGDVEISIGGHGIRITPRSSPKAASAAAAAASAAQAADRAANAAASASQDGIRIVLPPGTTADSVREAVEDAKREIQQAIEQARDDV